MARESFEETQLLIEMRRSAAVLKHQQRKKKKRKEVTLRRNALPQRDHNVKRRAKELETQGYQWIRGRPVPGSRNIREKLCEEFGLSRAQLHRIITDRSRSGRQVTSTKKSISQSVSQSPVQTSKIVRDLLSSLSSDNTQRGVRGKPSSSISDGQQITTEVALHKTIDNLPLEDLEQLQAHVNGVLARRMGGPIAIRPPPSAARNPSVPASVMTKEALLEALTAYASCRPHVDVSAFTRWVDQRL
jgi:hypothetical protein